ncbi:hypothetical protein CN676_10405 [Bacillus wiedmannii]|uniref:hypothetical protein n=1 Tax=Bacillus wiedmannii TaxID=1890302 RepID=UPI000BEFDF64|nr:hypothetical protein [Bacillus wiedmannii]PEJ53031.1 hypothetical protein CN676_10405 [Bacillus wiedmannii]PGE57128.1 hypothetical protein COM65_24880 [Bacillus wiedmannii]PHE73267.1 hypothetical protein COF47_22805 [Bacillus wiedmannii]
MNLQQAKDSVEKWSHFIELVSNYEVNSLETEAIYEYALDNNVSNVAVKLNEKGHRIQGVRGPKKLNSNDVTEILQGEIIDELHSIIKNTLQKNQRKMKGRG